TCAQRTDEHIAFPFGKSIPGVERHAGNGNRWHPVDDRRLEPHMSWRCGLPRSLIRASVADDGPAIIAPRPQDVDLIAAVRTVFVFPYFPGSGMHRQTQRAAMAKCIHLRPV